MKKRLAFALLMLATISVTPVCKATAEESREQPQVIVVDTQVPDYSGILSEIESDTSEVADKTDDIYELVKKMYEDSKRVTNVYSVNRSVSNCPWQPSYEDINKYLGGNNALDAYIAMRKFKTDGTSSSTSKYSTVNTDTFNNGGLSNTTTPGGIKYEKPSTKVSRALEVLGYDMVITGDEVEYSSANGKVQIKYTSTPISNILTWKDVVMSMYKALDLPIVEYRFWAVSKAPNISTDEILRDGVFVFATRTLPDEYWKKAVRELGLAQQSDRRLISNGEFIVLVHQMMKLYGEPEMSEAEMNALLQVYGGSIPTYLSVRERDAYLYLKARGILNIDLDYEEALKLEDMLDILMCVKDKGSRTNFKDIQVTVDIGDQLVSEGFFPKTVTLSYGDSAIRVSEDIDYTDATSYDYFVELTNETMFVDASGSAVADPFIANRKDAPSKGAVLDSRYLGLYTDDNGKRWYHFTVPISNKQELIVNTQGDSDYPRNLLIGSAIGGGFYTVEKVGEVGASDEGRVYLKRIPFKDKEVPTAISKERYEEAQRVKESKKSAFTRFMDWIAPESVAYAATNFDTYMQGSSIYAELQRNGASTLVRLTNRELIDEEVINNLLRHYTSVNSSYTYKVEEELSDSNVLTVRIPICMREHFFSNVVRKDGTPKTFTAITSLRGSGLYFNYNELVEAGLLFSDVEGVVPSPEAGSDEQVLVLNSKNGQIRLNNATREIVVGNTLYHVRDDGTPLFKGVIENGKNILYVDFRAVFGWTYDMVDISIFGTGESYNVSVTQRDRDARSTTIRSVDVKPPAKFATYQAIETTDIVPGKAIGNTSNPMMLMTGKYTLANWILFQRYNVSEGKTEDYVFIFYPKHAFTSYNKEHPNDKIEIPNGWKKMEELVGYSINTGSKNKWVCRVVKLSSSTATKTGKFSYSEEYGYVYELPEKSKFSIKKYLNGNVLLPIAYDNNDKCLRNYNVNYTSNYPYGTRPVHGSSSAIQKSVDVFGKVENVSIEDPGKWYAAPAGVIAFYGSTNKYGYRVSSKVLEDKTAGNVNVVYFGTTACEREISNTAGGKPSIKMEFAKVDEEKYTAKFQVSDKLVVYKVMTLSSAAPGGTGVMTQSSKYVMYEANLTYKEAEVPEEEYEEVEFVDAEQKDIYDEDNYFLAKSFLTLIDEGSSFVIRLVFEITPLIFMILITILIGLSIAAEAKIVRILAEKLIDPVKILTLGSRDINNYRVRSCIFGAMLGYITFGLLYNGNLLRLINALLKWFGQLREYIQFL